MSKYTTELRYICESYAGLNESVGYSKINEVISKASKKIFDFDYPIFDEKYRDILERKIIKHFYMREIGMESVGLWKHYLDTRLNEIMPYYNQLYKSELLEFNPFYDVDVTREHTRTNAEDSLTSKEGNTIQNKQGTRNTTGNESTTNQGEKSKTRTSENNSTSDISNSGNTKTDENSKKSGSNTRNQNDTSNSDDKTENLNLFSDTPQGGIEGLETNGYLTNATKDKGSKNTTGNYESNVSETSETSDTMTNTFTDNRKTNEKTNNTENENNKESYTSTGEKERNENVTESDEATTTVKEKGTGNINSTEDYLEHVKGKQGVGSYASLLNEYRQTFLNIDMQVINELNDLFMLLW